MILQKSKGELMGRQVPSAPKNNEKTSIVKNIARRQVEKQRWDRGEEEPCNYTLYLGACKPFGVQARDDYLFF